MNNAMMHVAAMSAAMRKLLAGKPLAKPDNVEIAAAQEISPEIIARMLELARLGGTTFLALFTVEGDEALFEKVMIADGSTGHRQIKIGCGKFIQKSNNSFAIASFDPEDAYEYAFTRKGRTLVRRSITPAASRALEEMRGIQALVTLAASDDCQEEARTACILNM